MITTSMSSIRALAEHFNTGSSNGATPTSSAAPSMVPLPSSSSAAANHYTLGQHHADGHQFVPLPRSQHLNPIGGSAGGTSRHSETEDHHHQQHRRSVVADVPFLQGIHHVHGAPSSSSLGGTESPSRISPERSRGGDGRQSNIRDLTISTIGKKILGRLIIVGDVHGCPDQLHELARELKYDRRLDLLIIAGDLVNKGPDSQGAVRAAMELGAMAVVGNHDITVLELVEQIEARELDPFSRKTSRDPAVRVARELTDDCVQYLRSLPHVLRIPQYNLLVLHAGMNLSYALEDQSIRDLTHLRRLEWNSDRGRYDSIAKGNHGTLWAQLYEGPEVVVFGHDARSGFQNEAFAIGLDTGCCYGGALTSVVFPGRKFHSVPGLPKEKRLGADEDLDETSTRLDTPAREPSPAPSSFYDPVPLSNRSTPSSAMLAAASGESFPMAPAVQQFFQKHRQQSANGGVAPVAAAATSSMVVVESGSAVTKTLSMSQQSKGRETDPIQFLKSMVSPGGAASSSASITTATTSTSLLVAAAAAPPAATTTTSSSIAPPAQGGSAALPAAAVAPSSSSSTTAAAEEVQLETLQTLIKGHHCTAVLALLHTDRYRSFWSALLEDHHDRGGASSSSSAASSGHHHLFSSYTAACAFFSDLVDMIIAFTDREKVLSDETLDLVDLLLEVLNEKKQCLSPRALGRLATFSSRLEAGELKGLSKGVLKAIKVALK